FLIDDSCLIFAVLTFWFVRDKIARKQLDAVLYQADHRNGIQSRICHSLNDALPFYIRADKCQSDECAPERQHLCPAFNNLPSRCVSDLPHYCMVLFRHRFSSLYLLYSDDNSILLFARLVSSLGSIFPLNYVADGQRAFKNERFPLGPAQYRSHR